MRIFTSLLYTRIFFAIVTVLLFAATPSYSQRWEKIELNEPFASNYWLDVFFLPSNPQLGWVCGYKSMIMRTMDGGLTWAGTTVEPTGAVQLESIHFPTQSVGYTSGSKNIYRTVNGGASWQNITPDSVSSLWGCYFINADTGTVIGSGCGSTKQQFFSTTNGGATWKKFLSAVSNSGLTDLIIDQTGLGYAVSSQWLWRTLDTDSGRIWQTFMPTGAMTWHEEITHVKRSFLLPCAGTTCAGSNNVDDGGGMRFSTNDGSDWTEFSTVKHNYGAFLLSDSCGWVCGLGAQMYYTSNYGQTWELRNCGITADLDDTYFIDDTTGWVVGNKAIYHLTSAYRSLTKSSLNYGDACFPGVKNDTLYVKISSFFQAYGTIELTGNDRDEFRILEPGASFIAPACDSMRIVIQFHPTSDGEKTTNAIIRFTDPTTELTIPLSGKTKRVLSFADSDSLIFRTAPCGKYTIDSLIFRNPSADTERVVRVERLIQDNPLTLISPLPLILPPIDSNSLQFQVAPVDTGWITTYHLVSIGVCSKVTTVKAYGTSPIISTPPNRTMLLNCNAYMLDTIFITNTGNMPLMIPSLKILGIDSSDYQIVGFTTGGSLPLSITPKNKTGVILRFGPVAAGQQKLAILRIENNDSTSVRGAMNPLNMYLVGLLGSSILSVSDTVVNCGDICLNSTEKFKFKIKNIGTAPAKITSITSKERSFSFSANVGTEIGQVDSLTITVFATPDREGIINDTLRFTLDPCGETFTVVLNCRGVKTSLESSPVEIRETIQSGRIVKRSVSVKSTGSAQTIINSITLTPPRPDWKLIDIPPLPDTLDIGEQLLVNVEFSASDDALFDGKVCFSATENCPVQICVPILVQSVASRLGFSVSELDFGDNHCILPNNRLSFTIKNDGTLRDTINVVQTKGDPIYTLVSPTSGLLELNGGISGTVEVEYKPTSDGTHLGELSVWSVKQDTVRFSVPLRGSFARTNTTITSNISKKILELCDSPVFDTVVFQNTGSITDTILITSGSTQSGFSIFPVDRIIISPNTFQQAIITTSPPGFQAVGTYSQSYTFTGNCSEKFDVLAGCTIIHPKLLIDPVSLDFGSISQGDTSIMKIITSNPTQSPKKIIGIDLTSGTPDFAPIIPMLPLLIPPGVTDTITIRFIAFSLGKSTGVLHIVEQSICSDTTIVEMQADVFHDSFKGRVVIDNYNAKYGELLTIPLHLEQSLLSADIEKLTSEIEFDNKLLMILKVTRSGDTIPYSINQGLLKVEQITTSKDELGSIGEIFSIKALALLSAPDTTTLHIKQFTVQSRKDIEIEKKDGFLTIDDGCHIALGLTALPTLTTQISSPVPAREKIDLIMKSTVVVQYADIVVTDIMGETRFSATASASQTPALFSIPTTEFPAGVYFLSVSSMGRTFREKIVVVK
ncbi:MAG: choice-of-anchor D domain-containing protein [Ignavibacteriae bacterium]|nr:choice-of-anchor D domain-containing protein [Ignavibacteriota bacterium]